MTGTVRWQPLAETAPGTPLAADLNDGSGAMLLSAGTRLDARRLEQLARLGIATVPVAPPPEASGKGGDDALRAGEIRQRLERRFAQAGQGPASRVLFQLLLARQLERR